MPWDLCYDYDGAVIAGYKLVMTCPASPEQYEVFANDTQVGYLRLRHGHFTVETPNVGGTLVYAAEPEGDAMFEKHEREAYLTRAVEAIDAHIKTQGTNGPPL